MRSSGMKKGLAASAVSALAVAGLSLAAPANADPISPWGAGVINLLSPGAHPSSSSSAVNLVAASDDAVQAKFEVSINGGPWTLVANVTRDSDGLFRTTWVPTLVSSNDTFRVTGLAADASIVDATVTSAVVPVDNTVAAATLDAGPSQGIGVSPNGRATITGTTTAPDGAVNVTVVGDHTTSGPTPVATATVSGGKFTAQVNLSGYNWTPGTNKEIFSVRIGGATQVQDQREYTLYKQTVTSETVSAQTSVGVLNGSDIAVTVTDQFGAPITGIRVFGYDPSSNLQFTGTTHQGPLGNGWSHNTNASGVATFTDVDAGTYNLAVDEAALPAFIAGTDHTVSITVPIAAGSATTTSKLGDAFAVNEGAGNLSTPHDDLTTTVKDANGNLMGGKVVYYHWHYKPFNSGGTNVERDLAGIDQGVGTVTQPGGQVDTRNVTSITAGPTFGTFNPWVPTLNGTDLQGGTFTLVGYVKDTNTGPGQAPGDVAFTKVIKVGTPQVVWTGTNGSTTIAQAQGFDGVAKSFKGTLTLPDGTPLGGQRVNVAWIPGNEVGVPGPPVASDATVPAGQPAGSTQLDATHAAVRTAADGTFSVNVTDPSSAPSGAYEDTGTLTASGSNLDTQPPSVYGFGPNVGASSLRVQFLKNMAPSAIALVDQTSGNATPGLADHIQATVTNVDGVRLLVPVNFGVDHGYLDKPLTIHHTGAANQLPSSLTGVFKNDGTSGVSASPTDFGHEYMYAAIGRDAGFDQAGKVDATITATAGSASATVVHHWSTDGQPLNWLPGSVKVNFSANQSQAALSAPPGYTGPGHAQFAGRGADGVAGLPKAAGNRSVWGDITVTDQFGNLTGANVTIGNSSPTKTTWDGTSEGQFASEGPALVMWDMVGQTVDETLNVSAPAGSQSQMTDAHSNPLSPVSSTDNANLTVNWYAIDYANSTFTLTHNGAATQPVNSTVTNTYHAVDQNGQPIAGLPVAFYRGGPDTQQNGQQVQEFFRTVTDTNGNAFYVFKGVAAGVGSVTAIPADQNGNPITSAQRDTSITFGNPAPQKVAIHASLSATRHGKRVALVASAGTNKAAGAKVNFYEVVKGHRKLIATVTANGNGVARTTHAAPKGTHRYVAVINATAKTNAGTSPIRSIR